MMDLKKIEEQVLRFWKDNKIYEKSVEKNKSGKPFYFLQGPPYTSGRLHIGHAWNNAMKDIALRYFRLKGRNVWDRAGYDMHGLPTANQVQKELDLKDKDSILEYGLDKFVKRCQEFSTNNAKLMNQDLKRLGVWMDFEDPYFPVTNEFMSSEWLLFKRAYEQDRLYKGKKIMHWCGECETSLAKHELEYENVTDNSIFLKFLKKGTQDEYFIIWTTTPWTILYNLGIMVNPDIEYVKIRVDNEYWIIAKALAGAFTSLLGKQYEIIDRFMGKELEGQEYVHPFYDKLKQVYDGLKSEYKNVHTILLSKEYVDVSSGSGLVHCAPGCGPEDFEVGQEYGIGAFNTLNEHGVLENVGDFSGMTAKVDDKKFVGVLKEVGSLITETPVEHEYAHCWRCHKPVVFRATEQWFLKVEDLVPKILKYDEKINWVPDTAKNSYQAWITNLKDNGVTRQRFWGTPAPIWVCGCGEIEVIGSEDELKKKAINKVPENLHKPWIDDVFLRCPECGKDMKRVPDVIDVWIDSGTASWNCLYYPKQKDYFEKFFPADLIIEATEQTRLWFSMLQICSTILFGKSCYKGVFGHGMILDFQGTKMSKSLGNIISPYEVIDKFSSEVLRYYICEITAGENANFNWEDVKQKQRNLLVLLNTGNYLCQLKTKESKRGLGLEEKYILSRLNSTIEKVTKLFEDYNFDKTITELEKMFLDISRVYIKMTREKSNENKELVYSTLKNVFVKTLKMFATTCPMITESIWQELRKKEIVAEESVHLCDWPKVDKKLIDVELEQEFENALVVIEKGLAERDKKGIGLKWPLAKAKVRSKRNVSDELKKIIANQLQVKEIELDINNIKEVAVELDTEITPDLEAEGFARNISRQVQSLRREMGLVKDDEIELVILTEPGLVLMLGGFKEFIQRRTNSRHIDVSAREVVENGFTDDKFKVKDKEIRIYIKK